MNNHLQPVLDLADAVQTHGFSGLLSVLPRVIRPGSGDLGKCVGDADFCMNDAGSNEEFWDCARDLAFCMKEVKADPELPGRDDKDDLATIVLAALIFQLRRQSKDYGKPS